MQTLAVTAFAARDHEPFIFGIRMSGDPRAVIIGNDVSLAAFRAGILAALIKKYIVPKADNLIESSWFIPDEFQITTLGGGVRNSFPFCILSDSIQSSSVTFNLSYFKTVQEGYNTSFSMIPARL